MSRSNRHHFVQAQHLKNFYGPNNALYIYGKDGSEFPSSATGIFFKNGLNSFETVDGISSAAEDAITEYENECFPAITRTLKSGSVAQNDIPLLALYMALSRARNPSFQNGVIDTHEQSVRSTILLMERNRRMSDFIPFPGREDTPLSELLADGTIEIKINNSVFLEKVDQQIQVGADLLTRGFCWNLVRSPRKRILIGDHPFTFLHPGKNFGAYGMPMGGDSCEIAFPLSSEYSLVGLWQKRPKSSESESAVDEINRRQAMFANRFLACPEPRQQTKELVFRHRRIGFKTASQSIDTGESFYTVIRAKISPLDPNAGALPKAAIQRAKSLTSLIGTRPT